MPDIAECCCCCCCRGGGGGEEATEGASSSPAAVGKGGSPGAAAATAAVAALPTPPGGLLWSIAAARDRTLSLCAVFAAASSGLGGSLRVLRSQADHSGGIVAASNFCGLEPEGVRTALRSTESAVAGASLPEEIASDAASAAWEEIDSTHL